MSQRSEGATICSIKGDSWGLFPPILIVGTGKRNPSGCGREAQSEATKRFKHANVVEVFQITRAGINPQQKRAAAFVHQG